MFTRLFQDFAAIQPGSLHEHRLSRFLLDSIVDYGIALLDVNGAFTLWNAAAQRLTGYDPEYVAGRQFADVFPGEPSDSDDRWLSLQETLKKGRSEFEVTYPPGAGPSQRLTLAVTPIRGEHGKHHGYVVVMRESAPPDSTLVRNTGKLSFELLVNSVEDYAIFMLDPDGRILSWNLGAERLKGYRADEIIGRDISVFYTAADRKTGRPQANLGLAAQNGRFEGEGWRVRKDGSLFWANVVITALRDKSGRLRGFGKVTRDLTRHYRATIAPMQNGMLLLCPEGSTFACNASACRLLGYPQEQIFGRHFGDLELQVVRENGTALARHELPPAVTLATGNLCHDVVLGFRTPGGTTNWVSVDTDVLGVDKTGHPTAIVMSMHDISKLKHSHDAIRRGEQLFRSLVAASAQIVWEADSDGTFRTISSSFETLTGKSARDAQGWGWLAALPAADQVRVKKAWQQMN